VLATPLGERLTMGFVKVSSQGSIPETMTMSFNHLSPSTTFQLLPRKVTPSFIHHRYIGFQLAIKKVSITSFDQDGINS
jgi:hypothetical protein